MTDADGCCATDRYSIPWRDPEVIESRQQWREEEIKEEEEERRRRRGDVEQIAGRGQMEVIRFKPNMERCTAIFRNNTMS